LHRQSTETVLDWIRRIFHRSDEEKREGMHEVLDALNAEAGGGPPITVRRRLGLLKLRCDTLVLGDPQYLPSIEVPDIVGREASISASFWQYPSGHESLTALRINLGNATSVDSRRRIGELGIDSAKLVVLDKEDFEQHWTKVGRDRIGVISTAPDDRMLKALEERFGLKTVRVNAVRAEVVGPVSDGLESEITSYVRSFPQYADFPFMWFRVQTNNSFDRVNYMPESWRFLPVGNDETPIMFACETGRGDGAYPVYCDFAGDRPCIFGRCVY